MSVQIYGVQFVCDLCGATGARDPVPADPPVIFSNLAMPDGWTNLALISLTFKDMWGSQITHLCPACSALDIHAMAARLQERFEQTRVAQ